MFCNSPNLYPLNPRSVGVVWSGIDGSVCSGSGVDGGADDTVCSGSGVDGGADDTVCTGVDGTVCTDVDGTVCTGVSGSGTDITFISTKFNSVCVGNLL